MPGMYRPLESTIVRARDALSHCPARVRPPARRRRRLARVVTQTTRTLTRTLAGHPVIATSGPNMQCGAR
jgi:hypothetical protein